MNAFKYYFGVGLFFMLQSFAHTQVSGVDIKRLETAAKKVETRCGKLSIPVMPSQADRLNGDIIRTAKVKKESFLKRVETYTKCLDQVIETQDPANPIVAEAALAHDFANIKYGEISEKYILTEIAWQDQSRTQ